MLFTLEAVKARRGDCLLLHTGTRETPSLVVVDGGWYKVWRQFLKPRLEELRQRRAPGGKLDVDLMMVSHIDADHIQGILDMTKEMKGSLGRQQIPWRIRELWHNSFDDVVGDGAETLASTADREVGVANLEDGTPVPPEVLDHHQGAVVLASVRQGRQLRLDAQALTIPVNATDSGHPLVLEGEERELEGGVTLRVLGPSRQQVEDLREKWDEWLEDEGLDQDPAEVAEFLDGSVYNLSSLVVLAEATGGDGRRRRMLLTGDARGDFILEALDRADLFDDAGRFHVDVFKLPHHGSDRNVDGPMFERITADHYVVSGDGAHGNPEVDTFRMIFDARRGDPFALHLTYPVDELEDPQHDYPKDELRRLFRDEQAANRDLEIHAVEPGRVSLKVDLLDPLED